MAVRFILGRAGSGKTQACLRQMANENKKQPLGAPLILLVPEQASFEMEKKLAVLCGGGTFRAQVLSFRRLAYRLLGERHSLPVITETGRQLLLRRLLQEKEPQLKIFAGAARQPGFSAQLAVQIREFRHYRIEPEKLSAVSVGTKCPEVLKSKVSDLHVIYSAYQDFVKNGYYDPEDTMSELAVAVREGILPSGTQIWLDGFAGFTPQEYEVIAALFAKAEKVEVALCLDHRLERPPQEDDLFHPTEDTYLRLHALAKKAGAEIIPPLKLPLEKEKTRFAMPELGHLEKHFASLPPVPFPGKAENLKLVAAAGPRAEVEAVARDILHLVRERGCRFRDIAVILRSFSAYSDLVAAVFTEYRIPYYLDERQPAAHHPLAEFLRSALEAVNSGFKLPHVLQLLKTDILPISREAADIMENHALAHGISGSRWLDEKPFDYELNLTLDDGQREALPEEDKKLLEKGRREFRRHLRPFAQKMLAGGKQTVRKYCTYLWELLADASATLARWSEEAAGGERPEKAFEHRQVWQEIIEILEQNVAIQGDTLLTLSEFSQIFLAALENLKLGLVPMASDMVLIGNVERSRQPDLRAAYVLGLSEGDFPSRLTEEGLFADEERENMAESGLELAITRRLRLFHEQYLAYIALTRSSEYLWASYPLADEEGRAKRPSQLFKRLQRLFPENEVLFFGNTPDPEFDLHAFACPKQAAACLLQPAGRVVKGEEISPFWAAVYNEALNHEQTLEQMKELWPALAYNNRVPQLLPRTAAALWGQDLHSSVSRLEEYARCPFAHFARYGLRLKERREYSVDVSGMGTFYHEALRRFVERLLAEKTDMSTLSVAEAEERMKSIVDELIPELNREILLSSARMRFLAERLKEILANAAAAVIVHIKKSGFKPAAVELAFGNTQFPAWEINCSDRKVYVYGKIDRVDVAKIQDKIYFRIIDYKSSPTKLDLSDFWHGLSLQLLLYMAMAKESVSSLFGGEDAEAAGAFYFGINPFYRRLPNPERKKEEEKEISKLEGLLLADPEVFQQMGGEELVNAKLKKDDSFTKYSRVAGRRELEQLYDFLKFKTAQLAKEILSGRAEVSPFKKENGNTACAYCPYKPFCCFDTAVAGNGYRLLKSYSHEEVLQSVAAWQKGDAENGR